MKIKLRENKIKEVLTKLPRVLAEQTFLTFLGLLFLSLIFGGILLYKYDILAQREKPEVLITPLKFQEDVFQRILKVKTEREKRFKEAAFKEYPNPFQRLPP